MFCKRIGSNGHVMLYTATKRGDPNMEQCNADGSPLTPPVESPVAAVEATVAKIRRRRASADTAVQDYESGAVVTPAE